MPEHPRSLTGIVASFLLAAFLTVPAYAADTAGRSGLEGAAEALRNELAPSMLTFGRYQEAQGAEGSVSIENARIQGLQDVMYSGQPETPTATLKLGDKTLRSGDDFDIEFSGDNVNPGTVSVLITGKGAYTGGIETSFTILPGDLSYATVDVIPDQTATGEEIRPDPVVKINGHELVPGIDYVVEYRNNTEEGTAAIVVRGIGNCTGETHTTFEIIEGAEDGSGPAVPSSIPIASVALVAIAIAVLALVGVFALRRRKAAGEKPRPED